MSGSPPTPFNVVSVTDGNGAGITVHGESDWPSNSYHHERIHNTGQH